MDYNDFAVPLPADDRYEASLARLDDIPEPTLADLNGIEFDQAVSDLDDWLAIA